MGIIETLQDLLGLNAQNREEFGDYEGYENYEDRVSLSPASPGPGENLRVDYRGLLRESGATEVYLHYGFDGWERPRTIMMERRADGVFTAEVHGEGRSELDFCFKDAVGNWDNNGGRDWVVELG